MNKKFSFYVIIWAIILAVFNVICFVTPSEAAGMSKFGGAFWIGYVFITISFIGQLICAFVAFKGENLQKVFYNIPLVAISYIGLIVSIIIGILCMVIPNLPNWIGIIVCTIVLAITAISVIGAKGASDAVSDIDGKVKTKTSFIRMTMVNAQNLIGRAKSDATRGACNKVFEALRYSDPMSNDALSLEEAQITVKMAEFSTAVGEDSSEKAITIAEELVTLIKERNNKCKLLK